VVLVCDRYSAYKCLAKDHDALILAFGWAHVRRDFLGAARRWPALESWMFTWGDDIRALYRLKTARCEVWDETVPLYVPADRIDCQDRSRLPNRLRDMRYQETPCEQRQMRVGRRIAFFLGGLPGRPSPGMDDLLWDARGNQARRHLLLGADQDGLFEDRPLDRGKTTGQRHRRDAVSHRFSQRCLRIETTDKIGLGGGNLGQRFDREIP
jgi:Transposase IS66 family